MRTIKQILPLGVAMAGLLLLFSVWVPNFMNPENMLNLIQQISVNAILAFGMTLVILIGGIDLSVGALLALVGTTTVFIINRAPAEGQDLVWLAGAVVVGLAVAAVFGAFNGLCAAKTKMPAFIITLAMMLVARGAALRFNEGRPIPIPDHQKIFRALGNGRLFEAAPSEKRNIDEISGVKDKARGGIPVPVIVMLTLFALMAVLLHRTRFGQHLYAIGGNREAARFTGIPIVRNEIIVYMICSILTGIAGMIHTSQLYAAEPGSGVGFELNAIAAAVVGGTSFTGGRATMYGTLIGAVIIGILDKGLNQAEIHYSIQHIMKGLVILVAVYIDVRRRSR